MRVVGNLTERRLLIGACLVLAPLLAAAAWKFHAQSAAPPVVERLASDVPERVRFESYNAVWSELASGAYRSKPVQLGAELFMPSASSARVPAAVFLHGSDGITTHHRRVAASMRELGIAVLLVDSFGGRGVDETVDDQAAVPAHAMLVDAYRALALIATHPNVDPQRIAIVGWSKGGMVADWASRERYRAMLAAPGVRFAAHAAFYPWCGEQHRPVALTGAPLLYLIGENDDWTGVAPCRDYAKQVAAAGFNVELVAYPDAEHGFDYPGHFRHYLRRADSWIGCNYVWGESTFRVVETGELLRWSEYPRYIARCTRFGAHVGTNTRAREAALAKLRGFLVASLRP